MLPGKQHQKKKLLLVHFVPPSPSTSYTIFLFCHSIPSFTLALHGAKKKATAKKERKTRKLSYTRDSGGIWNVSQDQAEVSESEMANRINRAERMRRTRASGNEEFSLFLASFHGLCRGRSSNKSRKQVFRIAGFVASMFYLFCSFLFWSKLVFYFFSLHKFPFNIYAVCEMKVRTRSVYW